MTPYEMRLLNDNLVLEPLAVVVLYQSHCLVTNSTLPYMKQLAAEHHFLMVPCLCDHVTAEAAGTSLPSVKVYRYGAQTAGPIRGAKTKKALLEFLKKSGVLDGPRVPVASRP